MNDVHDLFDAGTRRDQEVLDRLAGRGRPTEPQLALDAADLAHVFTLDQIRQTCIRFRLRFLDTRFFRSEFPYDAVLKIRAFEERYNIRIERFRIAAPDHAFKLENINKDPCSLPNWRTVDTIFCISGEKTWPGTNDSCSGHYKTSRPSC